MLAKLLAAVRPEFRVDVFVPDPDDPVLSMPPCRVPDCPARRRTRGLCPPHYLRWQRQGRPDLDGFVAAVDPAVRGRSSLVACLVPMCRFGAARAGLCSRHHGYWQRAGQPDRLVWVNDRAPGLGQEHPTCRLLFCALWAEGRLPFCRGHADRWRAHGLPDVEAFARACASYGEARFDFRPLTFPGLKLEFQYALQCRHDQREGRLQPMVVVPVVRVAAAAGVRSLLDWPVDRWEREFPNLDPRGALWQGERGFLRYARARVEDLVQGGGWDAEFPRDVWNLRRLGISRERSAAARLRFDRIPQPWLRELAKQWIRWRLSAGTSGSYAALIVRALIRLAHFLATATEVAGLAELSREVLERYLAWLAADGLSTRSHTKDLGVVRVFLDAIRQHGWDQTLPASAVIYPEDFPEPPRRLPRFLAEHVMAQVEHPDSLDRWPEAAGRLLTVILIGCGLRVGDATRLPFDCVVRDAAGTPYLRYINHKLNREALVPIDDELAREIAQQQRRVLDRWPAGTLLLFPQPKSNQDGRKPLTTNAYRGQLNRWLASCDVRDEHGRPVHLTPHQWRHTFATRLINRDVPQEVVRVLLDHDSHEMTGHYARISDQTVRRRWEQARKVNVRGETVSVDPASPLADASWAKHRVGLATQALPNGFCGLPLQQTCPHANACLTCPVFITTPEFLDKHREHREQTRQLIAGATARGQLRLVEMNQQVLGNLDRIITALDADHGPHAQEAADAG